MKTATVVIFILLAFNPVISQDSSPVMKEIKDTELKMGLPMEEADKWVSLTNNNGKNNLENYPVRPEYSFPGNEVVYKLPKMDGAYFFYVNDRKPDKEVDLFVLTDPNDAASAIMWMNGTGNKQYMEALPENDYYVVVDGFENITATLNFAIAPAVELPNVCIGSTEPIELKDLRTLDPSATEINYRRLSGMGGTFDDVNGIFTPDVNTTDSEFEIVTNFSDKVNVMTENITIMMVGCIDTFISLNELNFSDPCFCDNVELLNSETREYYFRDTLRIEASPGQTIVFSAAGSSDFYSAPGQEMPDETLIPEQESGIYELVFYKLNATQAVGFVSINDQTPVQIPEEDLEVCNFIDCPALIPTLNQWGIFILGLLVAIFGLLFAKGRITSFRKERI